MVKRTLVAVLASRDSIVKNNELARVFETLYDYDRPDREKGNSLLGQFHFIFCGGTFGRLMRGMDQIDPHIICGKEESRISWKKPPTEKDIKKFTEKIFPIRTDVMKFLSRTNEDSTPNITVLPNHVNGGVTLISKLVVERTCNIVWPFFSPITEHWTCPENLALLRLFATST